MDDWAVFRHQLGAAGVVFVGTEAECRYWYGQWRQERIDEKARVQLYLCRLEETVDVSALSRAARIVGGTDFNALVHAAGYVYSVDIDDILGSSKAGRAPQARSMVMLIAHDLMGYSYPFIGKIFDRDHSTIQHHCRSLRTVMAEDRAVAYEYEIVRKLCIGQETPSCSSDSESEKS